MSEGGSIVTSLSTESGPRRCWSTDGGYLDIFGSHPDVSEVRSTVSTMSSSATEDTTPVPVSELTEQDKEILEFERSWWKHAGGRDTAIRRKFNMSPTRYSQIVVTLIDNPQAMVYDPMTVKRLQRLRDARRAQRSSRHRLS